MTAITFPTNPHTGDEFVAHNGVTYIWMGDRWNGSHAILTGKASPIYDGEYASSIYNSYSDNTLDGGINNFIGAK
jgi:hypothetical protein